jgi:ubiquinone/menaquinone biosynthesis C-methylase UbiE
LSQPTERFSSRVENYVKYRPGYPPAIVDQLKLDCGLTSDSVIADLGSGTGKLAELFLNNGNKVFGVEPNAAMRNAAEQLLTHFPTFVSIDGSAESSTLSDSSVDFITAGQAFHWFDVPKARVECARILKTGGWVVLIWNDRKLETTPFLSDYEHLLLQFGTDYKEVRHDHATQSINDFFGPAEVSCRSFPNQQIFDLEGLKGRVFSSSYTPEPDQPAFIPMVEKLEQIFDQHQQNGLVTFDYDTRIYFGKLH